MSGANPVAVAEGEAIRAAILALLLDARDDDRPMTVRQLAARLDRAPSTIGKHIELLTAAGRVVATRGRFGGVRAIRV